MNDKKETARLEIVRLPEHQRLKANTDILTTAAGAIVILLAFTCSHGVEQLLLVSLGGLLAGGTK
jgi:hypothetical protein